MPRSPRPRSTTTMTPPACQTAYSATVSSIDGGTSNATRSPGLTPAAARPAAVSLTRACSSAQLMLRPLTSTTAGLRSPARAASSVSSVGTGCWDGRAGCSDGCGAATDCSWESHRFTASAYSGASSGSRWLAFSYRCRTACGSRCCRSRRCSSRNTGSRGPQSSSAGTSRSAMPAAIRSSSGRLGWSAANGMSATNSLTPSRPATVAYGAANASRTSRGSRGQVSDVVVRTNSGVHRQANRLINGTCTSRIRIGPAEPSGWCTAVLVSTTPRSCSRCAAAQPSEMIPPQSCATVTTGPVMPSASVSRPRSSTRCRRTRGCSRRSE